MEATIIASATPNPHAMQDHQPAAIPMAAPVPTPIATAEAPFMLPPDDPERPEARAESTEAEIGERDPTTT